MTTTKNQVEKAIAKGTTDPIVQYHIDYVKKAWEEGTKEDLDLQFSYDVICDNSPHAERCFPHLSSLAYILIVAGAFAQVGYHDYLALAAGVIH